MKRTKEDIIINILELCLNETSKTALVYKSNLNFMTVKPYLDSLIKAGYIAIIEGPPRRYKATDKGLELLKGLKEVHEFL